MQRGIPDGIEERVSLLVTSRGYTAARWDVNAYRDPALVEFVAITALLSGRAILSTSLSVTISSMRHGSGATLQIA
jgi:hypothetical protein